MRIVPRYRSDYWYFCAQMAGMIFSIAVILIFTLFVLFAL